MYVEEYSDFANPQMEGYLNFTGQQGGGCTDITRKIAFSLDDF